MHTVGLFFRSFKTLLDRGKVAWPLFFAFAPAVLPAQYERILNDPNVVWAAEVDIVYALHRPDKDFPEWQNDIVFWKNYDPKSRTLHEDGAFLIEKILAAARSGAWPAWELGTTPRRLSPDEVAARLDERDTIEVLDFATGVHRAQAIVNEVDIASFFAIRAKQLLYFDEKKAEFRLYTSAIAPVRHVYNPLAQPADILRDSILFDYVPFWLKMPDFSPKTDRKGPGINSPNITWAARLKTANNSPWLDSLRLFKDFRRPVMRVLLDRFRGDRRFEAYDALGAPVDFAQREELLVETDTLVTFDPETYEEKLVFVREEIREEELQRLRLVQDWYWDARRQRLLIRLHDSAPLVPVLDNDGNFRYWRPLFFRRG